MWSGSVVVVVALVLGLALIAGAIVVVVSRRSHLRSWRFGVFYESDERFGDPPEPPPTDQ